MIIVKNVPPPDSHNNINDNYNIKYAIPLLYSSSICFLFGYTKFVYTSDFINFYGPYDSSDLTNTIQATTPLYNDSYLITFVLFGDKFQYLKKNVGSSLSTLRTPSTTLKENGNVCFFQMRYLSINYYYSSWIDRDSYINIVRLDFNNLNDISNTKSDISIKGSTIDCKAFDIYGDIICIYVGHDGCNLNVYNKTISNDYSQTLFQKNNLVDLGFNCDTTSPAQKIYNIDGNKFFVCYNKEISNTFSFYCIIDEHESEGSIKIKSESSIQLLNNCDLRYYGFFIGDISSNYIIVCTRYESIYYTIFDENFEISYIQSYSYPNGTDLFSLTLPYVFTFKSKTYIIFNYKELSSSTFQVIYEYTKIITLDSPKCKNINIPGDYSMNKDIIVSLSNGIDIIPSTVSNNRLIRLFKLPPTIISGIDTSSNYIIDSISQIIFNFPKGGKYTFSFYLIDDFYKTISSVCKGTINVYSCYESCETCSTQPYLSSHRCNTCLRLSGYYPLIETQYNSIKNCYNSTTILTLEHGYYLYNGYWYECYYKCKKCISFGNDFEHKCTQCRNNFILDYYNNNYCAIKCDKYWRRDDNKIDHICLDKCNNDYPYEVEDTYECVNSCISANNNGKKYYYYNEKCILKCPYNTLTDGINQQCLTLNYFDKFYNGIVNYIISMNPPSNIYIYNDIINFILFNSTDESIESYKNYCEEYNMAILDLSKCFEELRILYQNAKFLNFYIALFNLKRNDTLTPQFDFIIYDQCGIKYKMKL